MIRYEITPMIGKKKNALPRPLLADHVGSSRRWRTVERPADEFHQGCEYDHELSIVTAIDPERGVDWKQLRELIDGTSDDELVPAQDDYPGSATVEIRSILVERVVDLEGRWEAIFVHSADHSRWLELDEDDARAVSVLNALSLLQPVGAMLENE